MLHMENASLQSTTISITIFLDHLIPYVIVNFPEPIYPIRLGSNVSTTRGCIILIFLTSSLAAFFLSPRL